jgi:alkanesulfonate monooxygenase SsuD/methylene tetrahydromethanopterin reductase-like flavin-dependent oxidoreductase (luciferase family)
MGAPDMNFHADVFARMGYGDVIAEIGELFRTGRKDEAATAIPDDLVRDVMIVGTPAQVRDQVSQWEKAGVTMLLTSCRTPAEIHRLADVVG